MKKLLLLLPFILCYTLHAQVCTPDTTIKNPGMYPRVLPDAKVTVAYNETIQFKFPTDTTFGGIPVHFDSVRIDNVQGMPAGFIYTCNASGCKYLSGSNGCVVVTGLPSSTEAGQYMLKVTAYAKLIFAGTPIWAPYTDSVPLKVVMNSSIENFVHASGTNFHIFPNFPDPFRYQTNIDFAIPESAHILFRVYDILGNLLFVENYSAHTGDNQIIFKNPNLKPGIYWYSLTGNNEQVFEKMVIEDLE